MDTNLRFTYITFTTIWKVLKDLNVNNYILSKIKEPFRKPEDTQSNKMGP